MAGLIGKEIGKYRITERIGRGGMAEVYLGVHTHLDRQVAIKVLHGYLLEGGDFIERFKREAKAVASLRHPNIVQVYDFDIKDEIIFMVMEYIQGTNLQQRLVELDKKGERLPIKQIGSIINDIAGALDYAHSQGMLHRDVKPSNILIDGEGKAYLTDFGIARILGDHKLTATGTLVGTPAYMSPEQGRGEELTEESDIYSLGIVAFEMLTGRIPFDAKTPIGIVQKQIFEPVPDISKLVDGVPVTAQGVIDRALAKTPEGRYASAEELVGALKIALQALESAEPITVLPASTKVDEEKLSAPTVAMEEVSAPGEFEKPTVLMGEGQEPEQQAEAGLPERETKQARVKAEKPKRKIPLWGLVTAGVAVLAIAAFALAQMIGPGPSGEEPGVAFAGETEAPVSGVTEAAEPDQPASEPEPALVRIRLVSTCDYTTLDLLSGANMIEPEIVSVSEVATIAEVGRSRFSLNQPIARATSGEEVEMIVDAQFTAWKNTGTLVFEIQHGALGSTKVELYRTTYAQQTLVESFEWGGTTGVPGNAKQFQVPAFVLFGPIPHTSMSSEGAEVTFDSEHTSNGLHLLSLGDVDTEIILVGESQEQAWRTGNNQVLPSEDDNQIEDRFMDFDIADEYMYYVPSGSEVRIEIEYLDEGTDRFHVEYDARSGGPFNDGTYKETEEIQKTGSGLFKTAEFTLSDTFFGNRVNSGDFRISDNADGPETIRRVTVTLLP